MTKRRNSRICKVGDAVSVDIETGEETPIEGGGFRMLPGPPGSCEWCYTHHDLEDPHNQESLSYQIKFYAINKRYPTWTDAMAHCTPKLREIWKSEIIRTMKAHGIEIPPDLQDHA